MENQIDYEMAGLLRRFVDLQTYDKIITALNITKEKNNLNVEEFNHILYLTLKMIGFIDVFYFYDIKMYDDYVDTICDVLEKYGDYLAKGTYTLYFELVNILYNIQFIKTNKNMKEFLIKKILENKAFNYDFGLIDHTELVENLSYRKKMNKKMLSKYLDFQYKSDHTIIIDFLKEFFSEITYFDYSLLARYFKEKFDSISMINNKVFSKKDYEHLELIKSLDSYEVDIDDLLELEQWIRSNIFEDNGHSLKTNFNQLYRIIRDYLEEFKPEKKDSIVLDISELKNKIK